MSHEPPDIHTFERFESDAGDPDPSRHVLVVEDDQELAELLVLWIRAHYGDAASVHVAGSLEEGTELMTGLHELEFVLLDRRLPEGTGDSLLDALNARFDPIVIMITAMDPDEGIIRLPISDYLVKPINRETLIKRLTLLEKLRVAGILHHYTNARKASLLEYHLEDPDDHPLYRRFAARWSYDRLELADGGDETFVYELYLGGDDSADGADKQVSVSVVGSVTEDVANLVYAGELSPVGELVPSDGDHAWVTVHRSGFIEPPPDGYVIYEFVGETPEQFVRTGTTEAGLALGRVLERTFG